MSVFDGSLAVYEAKAYAATIDWGDGTTPTAGHVYPNSPNATYNFVVMGTRTYEAAGTYTVNVTVNRDSQLYST